jgi:hypothetical protein
MDKMSPDPHAVGSNRFALTRQAHSGSVSRVVGPLAVLLCALACGSLLFRAPTNGLAKDHDDAPAADHGTSDHKAFQPFAGWPKPDLAIVFSGQGLGYLQPCGCSDPQYGGLARRYNFIQSLKEKGWAVMPIDMGDNLALAKSSSTALDRGEQAMLKYQTFMRALKAMGYGAVGLGEKEYALPLHVALAQHTVGDVEPRVVATDLESTDPMGVWGKMNVNKVQLVTSGVFKVGVLNILGDRAAQAALKDLAPREKADIKFISPSAALEEGLKRLKAAGANVGVLILHGDNKEASAFAVEAYKLYKTGAAPLVHAVVWLDNTPGRQLPPPDAGAPSTQLIPVGEKGKTVSVLGFFRNPKNLLMRYELVDIGPEFQPTEKNAKGNPVVDVMQHYSDRVKQLDWLGKTPRNLHATQVMHEKASYVGSERCGDCHAAAYKVWEKSKHAHAYKALVDAKFPSGRQYDPECIVCHTVGFPHKTGFMDPPAGANPANIAKHNQKLRDVGCESCHGPGSVHANNTNDKDIHNLINWRRKDPLVPVKRRQDLIQWMCQKCHDEENDVHWKFEERWPPVAHPTPKTEDEKE